LNRVSVTLTTAIAPALWGTTYLTTTELLPPHHPFFTGAMRSLPVGLLITLLLRQLPRGVWWWRTAVVGMLNFGVCFLFLFIGVYRLPGGVAATIGAIQPLLVALLGWPLLGLRPSRLLLAVGLAGILGVSMLVLGGDVRLDPIGIAAAIAAAVCMATGTIFVKRWGRPAGVSVLGYTGLQLLVGGLFLTPVMLLFEGLPARFTVHNAAGFLYLCLAGTAFAYMLWFRGIGHLPASSVTFLNLLIPIVASVAGFLAYGQSFTAIQLVGIATIVASIVIAQGTNSGAYRAGASAPWHLRPWSRANAAPRSG
jgi:probable blue pigment (indigoidine) exporter